MEMCVRIIFDSDPGIDDAVALLMAFASPEINLLGLTTVVGNAPLSQITRNALQVRELGESGHVPLFQGCPRPLLSWTHYDPTQTSAQFDYVKKIHGEQGLGGSTLPPPTLEASDEHAVSFLMRSLRDAPEPITLLCTGPLTNLAIALIMAPDIRKNIERVLVMGGSRSRGNITETAEHNFFVDPHAAFVVFNSDLPIVLSTLDLTRKVAVTEDLLNRMRTSSFSVPRQVVDIIESRPQAHYEPGMTTNVLHDPTVVAYLLAPDLFQTCKATVQIVSEKGPDLGRSLISLDTEGSVTLLTDIHLEGFHTLMIDLLERL